MNYTSFVEASAAPLLHVAVLEHDLWTLTSLLNEDKSDLDRFWEDETALHVASRLGYYDIVEKLLEAGADSNLMSNFRHESPLYLAASKNYLNIVELLVSHGAQLCGKKGQGHFALQATARYGCARVANFLIQQGVDVDAMLPCQQTALTLSCQYGQFSVVKELLGTSCDVNALDSQGHTALYNAVLYQHLRIVEELLIHGADANVYVEGFQGYPLHAAVSSTNIKIIDTLLRANNTDPDVLQESGQTPLYMAVELGHVDTVVKLISFGADPDLEVSDTENTPLFAAMERSLLSVYLDTKKRPEKLVKLLIQAGCNVNHENRLGQTPLQAALDKQLCKVAQVLLEADCDLHAQCWLTSEMDFYIISLENGCPELYSTFIHDIKTPRCLRRLCRTVIRETVTERQSWPYKKAVQTLPLPIYLQNYVLYTDLPG